MRYIARTANPSKYQRLMIHMLPNNNCMLYLYDSIYDGNSVADLWFDDLQEALCQCNVDYGVEKKDWFVVGNPPENCRHDWITPARIPVQIDGAQKNECIELFIDKNWVQYQFDNLPPIKIEFSHFWKWELKLP